MRRSCRRGAVGVARIVLDAGCWILRCWLKMVAGKEPRPPRVAKITRHESYKEQLNGTIFGSVEWKSSCC